MARRNDKQPPKRKPEHDEDGLTPRERVILDRFMVHFNRSRAVREAARLEHRNRSGADLRVFDRPQVRMVLSRELAEYRRRHKLEAEWVLEQLGYMARSSILNLYNEDGTLKMPHELDEATAAAIKKVKFDKETGILLEYEFHSKTEAIVTAMKHLNILDTGGARQSDRLNEVIAAMREGPVERKTVEGQGEIR